MGRDSNGLYQPPYSLHVQEMHVCGPDSRGSHEVLTCNAPTDACDATCISGNYEGYIFQPMVKICAKHLLSRVFVHLENKHTEPNI